MESGVKGIADAREREAVSPDAGDLVREHKGDIAISVCFLEVVKEREVSHILDAAGEEVERGERVPLSLGKVESALEVDQLVSQIEKSGRDQHIVLVDEVGGRP